MLLRLSWACNCQPRCMPELILCKSTWSPTRGYRDTPKGDSAKTRGFLGSTRFAEYFLRCTSLATTKFNVSVDVLGDDGIASNKASQGPNMYTTMALPDTESGLQKLLFFPPTQRRHAFDTCRPASRRAGIEGFKECSFEMILF